MTKTLFSLAMKKIQSFMTAVCGPMLASFRGTEREREMKTQTEPVCQPFVNTVDIAVPVLISNHIWVKIFTVISGKSQILISKVHRTSCCRAIFTFSNFPGETKALQITAGLIH